ncbi:hypothetical protein [Clostridium sardiniense]|uniref:hypothetical protein n=1 Tax=Clostridium sardiniense TaxID=29369 RepID=UPI001956DE4F|nr:hypothetical protein [Clostridium sardiniense]
MNNEEENTRLPPELEEYLANLGLELADMEILGSILLIVGYSYFIIAANEDKENILNPNIPISPGRRIRPSRLLLIGEELILEGLIILWIVAIRRIHEKALEGSDESLDPYKRLANAYFLSVIANKERVIALAEIDRTNTDDEAFI